jgi:hypothetical protein
METAAFTGLSRVFSPSHHRNGCCKSATPPTRPSKRYQPPDLKPSRRPTHAEGRPPAPRPQANAFRTELLQAVEPDVHLISTLFALKNVLPVKTKEPPAPPSRKSQKVVDELRRKLERPTRQLPARRFTGTPATSFNWLDNSGSTREHFFSERPNEQRRTLNRFC